MSDIKTFEDKFDHKPNKIYEKDDDGDDLPPKSPLHLHAVPQIDNSAGGCLAGLGKIALSVGIIALCLLYICKPDTFSALTYRVMHMIPSPSVARTVAKKKTSPPTAPAVAKKTASPTAPAVAAPVRKKAAPDAPAKPAVRSVLTLRGAGSLPDFATAAKLNPDLYDYADALHRLRFETLDKHHDLVRRMIASWTRESAPEKIESLTGVPYKTFFNRISARVLSQTVLPKVGLTPTADDAMIAQDPVQIMATVYPYMKVAIANKTTARGVLGSVEPVSSFLLHVCRDDTECLGSWDLLIDMLGLGKYASLLEKYPEIIYADGKRL